MSIHKNVLLENVVQILMGQAPSSKDCNFNGEGTPFVKVGEFGSKRPVIKEWTTNPLRIASRNDVLLCVVGATCGKINLGEDCAIGRSVAAIRPAPEKLNQYYLYYFLMTLVEILRTGSVGAAQTVISKDMIANIQIPLATLSEQKRIVAILDQAFENIAIAKENAEQNLKNARELFESYLQSVFTQKSEGWTEKRIEEWCDSVMDCVNKTAPIVDSPTPFKMIRTTNVRHGLVDVSKVRFVTEETYKIWTRRQIPQKGDVILTREAPMGEVGMLLTDDKIFLGQRLVSYRVNAEKLDNQFLLFALQSGYLQDQIHAKASGSTVQHMRVPDTKNLLLAAPPLPKQRHVVAELLNIKEKTQNLESIYQQKIDALDELKKSLLHKAFSGEL